MTTQKPSKFNTTSNSKDYFPIKQHRFDTTKHPIILSTDPCKARLSTLLSQQEELMIHGLVNKLQCGRREAVRIALYEASQRKADVFNPFLERASSGSNLRGHTARSRKLVVSLPRTEKEDALELATILDLTEKEVIRLAVVWLSLSITSETVTALTDSQKISQEALARKWSREHQGQAPRIQHLKKARDAAYEQAAELGRQRDQELYEKRGAKMLELGRVAAGPDVDKEDQATNLTMIDALIALDDEEVIARIVEDEVKSSRLDEKESFIYRWMLVCPDLLPEEIQAIWEEEETERLEKQVTDQELEDLLVELMSHSKEENSESANELDQFMKRKLARQRMHLDMTPSDRRLEARISEFFGTDGRESLQ
jgi:hypothetical protein